MNREEEREHTLQRGLARGWANVTVCDFPGCERARRKDSISGMCKEHMHSAYCKCRSCKSGKYASPPKPPMEYSVPVKKVNLWKESPEQRPQLREITLPKEPWL